MVRIITIGMLFLILVVPVLGENTTTFAFSSREIAWTEDELTPLLHEKAQSEEQQFLGKKYQQFLQDPATPGKAHEMIQAFNDGKVKGAKDILKITEKEKLDRFLLHVRKTCNTSKLPEYAVKKRIVGEHSVFLVVVMPRTLLSPLLENDCIIKVADKKNKEAFITYAAHVMKQEADARIRELQLHQSSNDVTSYENVKQELEAAWERAKGSYSPLQQYVTPNDPIIRQLAAGKTHEELYALSQDWLWISDTALWKQDEHWILPIAFLQTTPGETDNPTDTPSSDCSEHANTLVSLLRANGVSSKDIRVAIGEVTFDDGVRGGHAWVELRVADSWTVLDSTVGPYYDEIAQEVYDRDGLPFLYWQYHPFPVEEVWAYYNDEFFLDLEADHAPRSWDTAAGGALERELAQAAKGGFFENILEFLIEMVSYFASWV